MTPKVVSDEAESAMQPATSVQAALVEADAALTDLRRAANWAVAAAGALIATEASPSTLRNYADRLLGVERQLHAVGIRLSSAAGSEDLIE